MCGCYGSAVILSVLNLGCKIKYVSIMKRISRPRASILRSFASAGLALGMAFAAGFVYINGKSTHAITMQKQKNMEKVKNNFSISDDPRSAYKRIVKDRNI